MNLHEYQKIILDFNGKDAYVQLHKSKINMLAGTRSPIEAALFLEELLSLTKYHKREWVYRTRAEWYKEVCLDEWSMRILIDDLKELGLIETKRKRAVLVGKKDEEGDPVTAVITHFRVCFDRLADMHMTYLQDKEGWVAPLVKSKKRNVTSSANEYYSDAELRDTQMLIKEELEEEPEENNNDASASRAASQPPTVSSDESPEERVQGADNLPLSGPLPADHETVGTDIKKPLPPTPLPSLSHFPSGTSVHPEPQTPLPDPPVSSTGHSLLDRMAQLQASGKEDIEVMRQAKRKKDKANRQHWAIRGSIENASEQAIFDMVGEQGYRYMLRLMKDIRTSADSILGWLKRRPALATVIDKLTDETYVVHLQAGIDKAKRHTSGWQASPLPWFFEAVLSEVPEEKRTATPNGNSRHEYKVRMDAAQTAQEVRSIIEEFKTRGQLETRMKRDEQRNLVRDKDGEPVYNSAEEEIMLVCEERGLSLTKPGEQ